MKSILTICLVLSLVSLSFAQESTFVVQGRVVDNADNSGIPGATVLFINVKDSTQSKGGASDENGAFKVDKLEKAFYRISIISLGYKPYSRIVRITASANLGDIGIEEDTFSIVLTSDDGIPLKPETNSFIYIAKTLGYSDQHAQNRQKRSQLM